MISMMDSSNKSPWKDDAALKLALQDLVAKNMKREEILDYMKRDFTQYQWSLRTLCRRMAYFGIRYIDYGISVDQVKEAVLEELGGVGQDLGYRAMNNVLRRKHDLKVPRHLVHTAMQELDPEGLDERSLGKKKKRKKVPFQSDGPLSVVSVDGHDKLCGYQNSTFPIAIYGCMDTFSRKILFLLCCQSNSNPHIIGRRYFDFLYETRCLPKYIRMDKGNETGKMAAIHLALTDVLDVMDEPKDSLKYGPSTTNKIERWWRELNEKLNPFFKEQLKTLLDGSEYDPHDRVDRQILAYVYIPIVQRECYTFVDNWNNHRIRQQKDLLLPTGVPNHMFSFPEQYDAEQCGSQIEIELLKNIGEESGVLDVDLDIQFEDRHVEHVCNTIIPDPGNIAASEAITVYRQLKGVMRNNVSQ